MNCFIDFVDKNNIFVIDRNMINFDDSTLKSQILKQFIFDNEFDDTSITNVNNWFYIRWRHEIDVDFFVISKIIIIFICSILVVMIIKFRFFFIVIERRNINFVFHVNLIRLLWFIKAIEKTRSIELIILKVNFRLNIILFELLLKINDRSKLKLLKKLKIDTLSRLK